MPVLKRILFSILILIFFLFFKNPVHASGVALTIDKTNVKNGDIINVELDISDAIWGEVSTAQTQTTLYYSRGGQLPAPKPDEEYQLLILVENESTSNVFKSSKHEWKLEYKINRKSSTCDLSHQGSSFVQQSCFSNDGGKNWKIKAQFKVEKFDIFGTGGAVYRLYATNKQKEHVETYRTFYLDQEHNAPFTLSIDPSKANPGETVTLTIHNNKSGTYKYRFQGGSDNLRQCLDEPECKIELKVPDKAIGDQTIYVFEGNNKDWIVLNVLGEESNEGKVFIDNLFDNLPPITAHCSELGDGGKCLSIDTGLGITLGTDAASFIKSLFGVLLSLSGGIALILIILSGYKIILARGNPEKMQGAKESLTAAIVGLLFIIFSLVILQVIGVDILKIPGFS